jgi:hypothetical protein
MIHADITELFGIFIYIHMCRRCYEVGHVCIHYSAHPGTNKDCSYANTYSINTEKPSKLKEKISCSKERI